MRVDTIWNDDAYFNLTKGTGIYATPDGKRIRILRCLNYMEVDEIVDTEGGIKLGIKKINAHNGNFTHAGFFC